MSDDLTRAFAALEHADEVMERLHSHVERLFRFQLIAIGVIFLVAIIVAVVLETKWRLEEKKRLGEVKEGGR